MNRQRIEHFIQVMRDVQARDQQQGHAHFDMHFWVSEPDDSNTCGTVACALGWLALSPEAQSVGLHYDRTCGCPVFNNYFYEERAGAAYLDIYNETANTLFFQSYYGPYTDMATPQNVIDRLEYLLKIGEEAYLEKLGYYEATKLPGGCYYKAEDQSCVPRSASARTKGA